MYKRQIIGGVYHAAILPIVLLEMESTGFSFLGAIDMTGLVMVSAGITLANVLFPRQKSDAAVALPGFLINLGFGTFVEASYPFMFSNKLVFGGAILASTVSGALVGLLGVKGTASVPSFMAPFLANELSLIHISLFALQALHKKARRVFVDGHNAVSYTHLDVYKRQAYTSLPSR